MMAIDVFLSRPTHVEMRYKAGLHALLTQLRDLEMLPHTLGTTDYPPKSPLDGVIELLGKCRGAVILGYPQIVVSTGSIREAPLREPIILPTEWNHIEAALAYARRLPLLVIHHVGVARGIFDHGALNGFMFSKDFADLAWPTDDDIVGAVRAWRDDVLGYAPPSESERALRVLR